MTPAFEIMEGENVRYEDSVDDGTWGCPYNGGLLCTNPISCLCRQVSKGVPDGLEQTNEERWSSVVTNDDTDTMFLYIFLLGQKH